MNNITVCGRLTKDIELKGKDSSVGSFSIADNYNKEECIFWNCTVFGKLAETVSKYKKKGDSITVVGTVREEEFKDKKYTKLYVNNIYFN